VAVDVYIDALTNDVELVPETGQLRRVSGTQLVAQRIRIRLRTHLGEWPLDLTKGVNWRDQVFVKNPNLGKISADFQRIILEVPGVDRFVPTPIIPGGFELSLDRVSRKLTVNYAVLVDGETVTETEVF